MRLLSRMKLFERAYRFWTEECGQVGGCDDTTLRSRPYQSPLFSFVTIPAVNPAGPAQADVLVPLPVPAKEILCVSCLAAQDSDSLYMHFTTLNKSYGIATNILPTGTEFWLPFNNTASWGGNNRRTGAGYKFKQVLPVQSLYFDIGHESGGSSPITFALGEDVLEYWKYLFT